MHIKSLVIDGFKSYCQRTEVNGFDPQFNAITGLNGSGKSNILDAVCFLLGITNLSQVRAANLQELVYKCGQAGITKATVSAVFDNLDKSQSPYGYEQFDELTITRQIVVGGKNKYLINGTNATNTRVHDLFHSVQLNVNNPHFLIMQGRITKILNMKPPEILSLLEEAASTKLYEHKKEVALKTIEKKDSKLREIDRVLREDINPTITKLREERSSYLEYQQVVREIGHLEKFVIAYDYTLLEEAKTRTKGDLQVLEKSLSEKKDNLVHTKESLAAEEQNIIELCGQRDEYRGAALEQLESQLSTCQKTEAVAKGVAQRAAEALKTEKKRISALNTQLTEATEQLSAKHQATEAAGGVEFEMAQADADDAKAYLEVAQRRLQTANSGLSSGADGVAASLAEQARLAEGERCSAQTELMQVQMREEHLRKELKGQEAQVAKLIGTGRKQSAEEAKQEQLRGEMERLVKSLARSEADDRAVGSEAMLAEQHLGLVKQARELRHKASTMSAQFPHLMFDYTDPERNFDRRRVLGPVAKLIKIKDLAYSNALEVAAGGKLYHIVVNSDETGKLLLEKGQLRRRVTMLPLNKIRGACIPREVVRQAEQLVGAENVRTALSLIDYPAELQPAMEYVFGNTLVCPDLDTARKVAFHPRVERRTVTCEGDVFDPQGTLSGGSRASATDSLLARLRNWSDAEEAASRSEEAVGRSEASLKAAAARTREIVQLRDQLDAARHRLGMLEAELRQTDRHRLLLDVSDTKAELAQVEVSLKTARERLERASSRAEQAHTKATNAVAEREREKQEAEQVLAEARRRYEATSLALRERLTTRDTYRLEADELAKEVNQLKLTLEEATGERLASVTETAEKSAIEARSATESLKSAREAVQRQRALVDDTIAAIAAAEKRAAKLTQSVNQTTGQVEKLTLQLELQTKESEEAGNKINRLLEAHPWIEDECQYFGAENGAYCFTSRDPGEARRRVGALKERRDRLSRTVNMRAMNMLGTAEEQYADLVKRQEIVLLDKRKIQSVIDDLDKRKKEVLLSAYDKVNEEFCNIFSSLLPGSRARLLPPDGMTVLDGLEIKVAFGDVWKESLGELSGGQRSLAALSLILALLLFKPAPLYILDEVDAALDLSHTQNIGQLIKNHFQHSQDGMFNNANVLFKTKFEDGVSTVTRHVPLGSANAKHADENRPKTDMTRKRTR